MIISNVDLSYSILEARTRIKDEYQLNGGKGECLMYGRARREHALPFNLRRDRSRFGQD